MALPAVPPRPGLILALVLLLSCWFMFVDGAPAPIVLWDESRLTVNALEMYLRGASLITTYDFLPDLWNTKPPLMIWLMNLSLWLFGPSEWSLRLPSTLAAIGTLCIVFDFTRKASRSAGTAALAAGLLATSIGFFAEHGARTADYDALLCFFVALYLHQLFFALHRRRPGRHLALAAAAMAGALMTKGIAAPIAAAGLLPYLIITRRFRRALATPPYYVAAAAAVAPLAIFLILRERAAPGYLDASLFNDVAGRVRASLDGQNRGAIFYLKALPELFSAGPLLFFAPLVLPKLRGRARLAVLYMLCATGGVLIIATFAATKLPQYVAPVLPPLAVVTAICSVRAYRLAREQLTSASTRLALSCAVLLFGIGVAARAADLRWTYFPSRQYYPAAMYGRVIEALAARGYRRIAIVDRGIVEAGLSDHYLPQARSYALIWRTRGIAVTISHDRPAPGAQVVASCDPTFTDRLNKQPTGLIAISGCAAGPVVDSPQLSTNGGAR